MSDIPNIPKLVEEFKQMKEDNRRTLKIADVIENFNYQQASWAVLRHNNRYPGLSGIGVVELLNRCVQLLPEDQIYLEIGTWMGKSLVGASLGNDRLCVGVDNFVDVKEEELKKQVFLNMYATLVSHPNIKFHQMDCEEFLTKFADEYKHKVGVYFYDGDHNFYYQYKCLELIQPFLADEAWVLVDDTHVDKIPNEPMLATLQVCKDYPDFKFVKEFGEPLGPEGFHQGLMVLHYKRNRGWQQ